MRTESPKYVCGRGSVRTPLGNTPDLLDFGEGKEWEWKGRERKSNLGNGEGGVGASWGKVAS